MYSPIYVSFHKPTVCCASNHLISSVKNITRLKVSVSGHIIYSRLLWILQPPIISLNTINFFLPFVEIVCFLGVRNWSFIYKLAKFSFQRFSKSVAQIFCSCAGFAACILQKEKVRSTISRTHLISVWCHELETESALSHTLCVLQNLTTY